MPTQSGHLVLADISGYTAFVADTELEHSREILNELLETIVRALAEHLTIGQIEGDAIFALGEKLPPDPAAWLEACFIKFHRHLNAIKRVTTCPCRACANVGVLTLKFVCHRGEYLPQTIGGKQTYVGNAVNMVHRLLKNAVPSREYIFATDEALGAFPNAVRQRFTLHAEKYDLGAITGGWMDIAPLRTDPRTEEIVRVIDEGHAQARLEHVYEATPEDVWRVLIDPETRKRWMGVSRVDYKPGARASLTGSEYHCIHGGGSETVFRVLEAKEPFQLTTLFSFFNVTIWMTTKLEDLGGGRTKLVNLYHFEAPPGPLGGVRRIAAMLIGRAYHMKSLDNIAGEIAALRVGPVPA